MQGGGGREPATLWHCPFTQAASYSPQAPSLIGGQPEQIALAIWLSWSLRVGEDFMLNAVPHPEEQAFGFRPTMQSVAFVQESASRAAISFWNSWAYPAWSQGPTEASIEIGTHEGQHCPGRTT